MKTQKPPRHAPTWLLLGLFLALASGFLVPAGVMAQEAEGPVSPTSPLFFFALFMLAGAGIAKFGNVLVPSRWFEHAPTRTPLLHFRSLRIMSEMFAAVGILYLLVLRMLPAIDPFASRPALAAPVFIILGILGIVARIHWPRTSRQYAFGIIVGTAATFSLISFEQSLFSGAPQDPYRMAVGMLMLVFGWRFLFGPWNATIKVIVLGTFVFWVGMHLVFNQLPEQRTAYILAAVTAAIPAALWCWLFLGYHKQRKSLAFLMFFAGMLSTVPILLYDKVLKSGAELQFFLFRLVPESFSNASSAFVSGSMLGVTGYQSTIISALISFMLVGLIEELSKFWVLRRSGEQEFTSIDDVLQLGIIVAIGFAFAENVLNPSYFQAFVYQHLLQGQPDWGAFIGNVLGRSILTNMVHIVATGILGYYYGLSLFSSNFLRDAHGSGRTVLIPALFQRVLRLPEQLVFAREMLLTGFLFAVLLHGIFNFLVTLSELLPGNPQTIGDIFGLAEGSPLHWVAILTLPSLFYVAGGFWLLSTLFYRKECMKERGHLVRVDTLVPGAL